MSHFVRSYRSQNNQHKQALESVQYGLEIYLRVKKSKVKNILTLRDFFYMAVALCLFSLDIA